MYSAIFLQGSWQLLYKVALLMRIDFLRSLGGLKTDDNGLLLINPRRRNAMLYLYLQKRPGVFIRLRVFRD